jgi:hypothetical protein
MLITAGFMVTTVTQAAIMIHFQRNKCKGIRFISGLAQSVQRQARAEDSDFHYLQG